MHVEVVEALDDDRTVIRRLLQLYHYDFSEFDGRDVNPHGEYLHRCFDEYWTDSDRQAFLLRVDSARPTLPWFLPEITRHRRVFRDAQVPGRRVGALAAASLFDRFPGRWTVRQDLRNPGATAFWRKAIRFPFQED